MDKNDRKRVLITGCSSGFGLLTAVKAAESGYEVIATMRNLDKADYLKQAADQADVTITIDKLDVTCQEDIDRIAEKYSPIDILINNAGILVMGSFLDIARRETQQVFQTNYFGAVNLTRAVVPAMMKNRSGMIINVSSLAGLVGHMFNEAYAASKHALVGFSQSIRFELAPFNIKVASVEPGYHKTEIIRANANACENFYDRYSEMFEWNRGFLRVMMDEIIPRAGDPEVVADKIIKIMQTKNPRLHYVIGKDARFATVLKWMGLNWWLEKQVFHKLKKAKRLENRREREKIEKRKAKRAAKAQEDQQ